MKLSDSCADDEFILIEKMTDLGIKSPDINPSSETSDYATELAFCNKRDIIDVVEELLL